VTSKAETAHLSPAIIGRHHRAIVVAPALMISALRVPALLAVLALTGCAWPDRAGAGGSHVTPFRSAEIEAGDPVIELPPITEGPNTHVAHAVGVRATLVKPEEFRGRTIVLRFKGLDDPGYRTLSSATPAVRFSVMADDGEAFIADNGWIYLISKSSPRIARLEPESGQSFAPAAAARSWTTNRKTP
jgi:hypothetical protein